MRLFGCSGAREVVQWPNMYTPNLTLIQLCHKQSCSLLQLTSKSPSFTYVFTCVVLYSSTHWVNGSNYFDVTTIYRCYEYIETWQHGEHDMVMSTELVVVCVSMKQWTERHCCFAERVLCGKMQWFTYNFEKIREVSLVHLKGITTSYDWASWLLLVDIHWWIYTYTAFRD